MPASTHPTDRLHVGAEEITFRVTSDQSKGKLVALETLIPAGGGPPMLHRHASFEAYRVDGGELAFYVEDEGGIVQRSVRRAGAVVAIPAGREHTIRNESDAPARAFVVFARRRGSGALRPGRAPPRSRWKRGAGRDRGLGRGARDGDRPACEGLA